MNHIRNLILIISFWLTGFVLLSAPLSFEPAFKVLPDGKQIKLYISGDEFFNYLHDENGFPVREGADGYYYYQVQKGDQFIFTALRAGYDEPSRDPDITEVRVPSTIETKRAEYQSMMAGSFIDRSRGSLAKTNDYLNNLVIYIKFSDEPYFSKTLDYFNTLFNDLSGSSVRNYYSEISGGRFNVVSYNFPDEKAGTFVYTDIYIRDYYKPYDSKTNIEGYETDNERTEREHALLERAVLWASGSASLPQGVNFDTDSNGVIDNVSFIVSGTPDGWGDLLWPHRWSLYTRTVKIGSLRVGGYTFQMENVSVTTLSHEMFHSLGAPDLYHYNNDRVSVGQWDIMANGKGHPCAWMKYKYGAWINEIPVIVKSGTYTLKPAGQGGLSAVIINSPYSDVQPFVAEYRQKSGLYESAIPATGLTIYRVDKRYDGNADGPPDEIYIFRQNGTPSSDGYPKIAALPGVSGSTSFNDTTNPYGFLQEGTISGLDIYDITDYGDSVTFSVNVDKLTDLQTLPFSYNLITLSWKASLGGDFIAAVSDGPETLKLVDGKTYYKGDTIGESGKVIYRSSLKTFSHGGLESDEEYYYTVWGVTDDVSNKYTVPVTASDRTGIFSIANLPHDEDFDDIETSLPMGWKSSLGAEGWRPDYSGPDPAITLFSSSDEMNILYTPGFTLTAGQKYAITFNYRNALPDIRESLFLKEGTERQVLSLDESTVFSSQDFSLTGEIMYRALIKPEQNGLHYLGFASGKNGSGVVLNKFRIEEVPEFTRILTDPGNFYPNPSDGHITVPVTARTSISVYGTNGTKLYETEIEGTNEVDLSHLGRGIYVIKFTAGDISSTGRLVIK
ncbi:MAG: M6 family metalloprotease domain-containing protein [Bacteroidales bacterium]|jgi:M6 family metalloprotease-like protein|nr:M6 family metalloprotease domain-containing protein [Bacteroidales bacterium]